MACASIDLWRSRRLRENFCKIVVVMIRLIIITSFYEKILDFCGGYCAYSRRWAATVSSGVLNASVGNSKVGKITVTSKSFKNNKNIPVKYTMNISPQLSFKTKSKDVKSYALLMYDKAKIAKNWVHWCYRYICR